MPPGRPSEVRGVKLRPDLRGSSTRRGRRDRRRRRPGPPLPEGAGGRHAGADRAVPGRGVRPVRPAADPPAGRRGRDPGDVPPGVPQPAAVGPEPGRCGPGCSGSRSTGAGPGWAGGPGGRSWPTTCTRRPARDDADDSAELVAEIRVALAGLRPEYRSVFVLFHEQGRSYEEIAAAHGRPVGTIKTWLHRTRLEVLTHLRRRGMVPAGEPTEPPATRR